MSKHADLVFNVTESDFESAVVERSRQVPVVVDFWAPWCGPCKALAPVLEKLVKKRNGEVLLAKVNTDDERGLAMKFGIQSLPTVIAFKMGQPVLHFMGNLPEEHLVGFFDQLVPSEADRLAGQALELEKSDPKKAEEVYRQALKSDPKHDGSMVGLARVLLEQRRDEEASAMLDQLPLGSNHETEAESLRGILTLRIQAMELGDEASLRKKVESDPKSAEGHYQLGCRLAAEGRYEEALAELLAAAERDPAMAKGKARETMVNIFQVIGVRSELADDYRDRLSSLLY